MDRLNTLAAPTVELPVACGSPSEKVIPVLGGRFVIGRDESCQLRPHSALVSRRHAEIEVDGKSVLLRDLDSRNGTLLNGKAVTSPARLMNGDRIQVGPLAITVTIRRPAKAAPPSFDQPVSDDEISQWLGIEAKTPPPAREDSSDLSGETLVGESESAEWDELPLADPDAIPPAPDISNDTAERLWKEMQFRPPAAE